MRQEYIGEGLRLQPLASLDAALLDRLEVLALGPPLDQALERALVLYVALELLAGGGKKFARFPAKFSTCSQM